MKKTLIALMALAGVALGSNITLESQLISADGISYGVYSQWEEIGGNKSLIEQYKTKYPQSLTFYVKVSDLFGAGALSSTEKYQITSFSFLGQANGNNSDDGDILTMAVVHGGNLLKCSAHRSGGNCRFSGRCGVRQARAKQEP